MVTVMLILMVRLDRLTVECPFAWQIGGEGGYYTIYDLEVPLQNKDIISLAGGRWLAVYDEQSHT